MMASVVHGNCILTPQHRPGKSITYSVLFIAFHMNCSHNTPYTTSSDIVHIQFLFVSLDKKLCIAFYIHHCSLSFHPFLYGKSSPLLTQLSKTVCNWYTQFIKIHQNHSTRLVFVDSILTLHKQYALQRKETCKEIITGSRTYFWLASIKAHLVTGFLTPLKIFFLLLLFPLFLYMLRKSSSSVSIYNRIPPTLFLKPVNRFVP